MNWFSKKLNLIKKSARRVGFLYRYLHDLSVVLDHAQAARGRPIHPRHILGYDDQVVATQTLLFSEINRANSRLHSLEHAVAHPEMADAVAEEIRQAVYQSLEYCFKYSISGSMMEFAARDGASACYIAQALDVYRQRFSQSDGGSLAAVRKFYLLNGLNEKPAARPKFSKPTCEYAPLPDLAQTIASFIPASHFTIINGCSASALASLASGVRLAFIHIQQDGHASTLPMLEQLFAQQQISPGCIILFDGWSEKSPPEQFHGKQIWESLTEKHFVKFSTLNGYGDLGHRYIVHEYK